MVFKNILVPYDATSFSNRAFQKALDIAISVAEKFDSKLSILMILGESQVNFWDDTEFKVGAEGSQIHLKKESTIYQ